MLHWLSSSKNNNPYPQRHTLATPSKVSDSLYNTPSSSAKTPNASTFFRRNDLEGVVGSSLLLSSHKRESIKRKLTDVLDDASENDENESIGNKSKRIAISPTKNILTDRNGNGSSSQNQFGTAHGLSEVENSNLDDSCQPFDEKMMDNLRHNSFRSTFSESKRNNSKEFTKDDADQFDVNASDIAMNFPLSKKFSSPVKPCMKSLFESPTANLPNFVKDGSSPHNRPIPVFNKKPSNWLNDLTKARRLKYGITPEKVSKSVEEVPNDHLRSQRNIKSKNFSSSFTSKPKKILQIAEDNNSPVTNSPKSKIGNRDRKKYIQTRLPFSKKE